MENSNYNRKQTVLTINGITIPPAHLATDEINMNRNEPLNSQMVGINGGVQNVVNTNETGTLTFSIFSGTDTHKTLKALTVSGLEFACSLKKGGVSGLIVGRGCSVGDVQHSDTSEAKVNYTINIAHIVEV